MPSTSIPVNVILASTSPRRKQLLEEAGVKFKVYKGSTEVDESLEPDLRAQPAEAVKKLAERKAGSVVQDILALNPVGLGIIIGADTTVVLDGEMLGKPYSADHAREMLRRLSGRTHEVITGVSVWMVMLNETEENGGDGNVSLAFRSFSESSFVTFKDLRRTHEVITGVSVWMVMLNETEENGGDGNVSLAFRSFSESSFVTFKDLTDEDINAYVATGETIDKAGAYAIQGKGAALVAGLEGDRDNVIGLPVSTLLKNFPDILKESLEAEVVEPRGRGRRGPGGVASSRVRAARSCCGGEDLLQNPNASPRSREGRLSLLLHWSAIVFMISAEAGEGA